MSLFEIRAGIQAGIRTAAAAAETVVAQAPSAPRDNLGRTYKDYDNAYATLEVLDNRPTTQAPLTVNSILLQGVGETFSPKNSATYTFGNSVVYTSGEGPREFNYTGVILVNDADEIDARREVQQVYDRTLRLSQSFRDGVEKQIVRLKYRDQIRLGYITSFTTSLNAMNLNRVDVSFTMFVTDVISQPPAGATPRNADGTVVADIRDVAERNSN